MDPVRACGARRPPERPRLRRLASAVSLASFALCAACSAPALRLHAGYMQTEVSGDLALESSTLAGGLGSIDPNVNLEDNLGITDPAGSVLLRAELDAGPVRLTGSAFTYSQDGVGVLNAQFGDLQVDADVSTMVDFWAVKGALTFDLLDLGPVRLSPGVGADLFDLQATVTDIDPQTPVDLSESIDELFPVPMVFLQAEADLGPVGAVVDVGGMDLDFDDIEGTFFDVEAMLYVAPLENLELFAGYRFISIDASGDLDGDGFAADLDIQGWFAGGGVSF